MSSQDNAPPKWRYKAVGPLLGHKEYIATAIKDFMDNSPALGPVYARWLAESRFNQKFGMPVPTGPRPKPGDGKDDPVAKTTTEKPPAIDTPPLPSKPDSDMASKDSALKPASDAASKTVINTDTKGGDLTTKPATAPLFVDKERPAVPVAVPARPTAPKPTDTSEAKKNAALQNQVAIPKQSAQATPSPTIFSKPGSTQQDKGDALHERYSTTKPSRPPSDSQFGQWYSMDADTVAGQNKHWKWYPSNPLMITSNAAPLDFSNMPKLPILQQRKPPQPKPEACINMHPLLLDFLIRMKLHGDNKTSMQHTTINHPGLGYREVPDGLLLWSLNEEQLQNASSIFQKWRDLCTKIITVKTTDVGLLIGPQGQTLNLARNNWDFYLMTPRQVKGANNDTKCQVAVCLTNGYDVDATMTSVLRWVANVLSTPLHWEKGLHEFLIPRPNIFDIEYDEANGKQWKSFFENLLCSAYRFKLSVAVDCEIKVEGFTTMQLLCLPQMAPKVCELLYAWMEDLAPGKYKEFIQRYEKNRRHADNRVLVPKPIGFEYVPPPRNDHWSDENSSGKQRPGGVWESVHKNHTS